MPAKASRSSAAVTVVRAEAGRRPVDRVAPRHDALEHGAALCHSLEHSVRQRHRLAAPGHIDHLLEGQVLAVEGDAHARPPRAGAAKRPPGPRLTPADTAAGSRVGLAPADRVPCRSAVWLSCGPSFAGREAGREPLMIAQPHP